MKIDPERLRTIREQKGLSRPQLAERSKISERTIQRLENEPQQSQKTREHTLNDLAKALSVESGVLTGDLPLPDFDKKPADDNPDPVPDPVHIGAQIAPKTRLAYDLIKRRYGVSATEIINMAPLFFALLAEGSLARRREKLKEAKEAIYQLDDMEDEIGHRIFVKAAIVGQDASESEEYSIAETDIFGEDLLDSDWSSFGFDPQIENPFAHYLRKLADELEISGVVDVDKGDLNFRLQYKFPHYEVWREELDCISKGSLKARMTLETGQVRLSEIPQDLMAEDAGEERAKWLEDKLPSIYEDMVSKATELQAIKAEAAEARRVIELSKTQSTIINVMVEAENYDDIPAVLGWNIEQCRKWLSDANSETQTGGDNE